MDEPGITVSRSTMHITSSVFLIKQHVVDLGVVVRYAAAFALGLSVGKNLDDARLFDKIQSPVVLPQPGFVCLPNRLFQCVDS